MIVSEGSFWTLEKEWVQTERHLWTAVPLRTPQVLHHSLASTSEQGLGHAPPWSVGVPRLSLASTVEVQFSAPHVGGEASYEEHLNAEQVQTWLASAGLRAELR